ncbi:HORMA domain containing protein [Actinomadura soli]|uniref:HORMA domain containing protein n=1 Tax=Actinomadura soli TaxID=2508997 RepID=A0A5C4J263_9ACTN|nr:HORMA domain containing protein [Actinomadura soli]TMQ90357.1 HORMA domain containing protein [Actinomadura soli]
MTTRVQVNLHTHAATHVATGMLRGLRQIVRGTGLDPARLVRQWDVLERGIAAWLRSRHLKALVLEVWDPALSSGQDLVGRFDFTIDYGYDADGDGELWLDADAVAFTIRKNGSYPSQCEYRVVADTSPGYPAVPGWSTTTLRSTRGFTRNSIGTAMTGASLGAGLAHYTRSN